jgi:hypothetical protein
VADPSIPVRAPKTKIVIPGYVEAIASEQRDRSIAFLGLPELVGGVKVEPLTPRRFEWLRAVNNPFVCGGEINLAAVLQFIWCMQLLFCIDTEKRDAFLELVSLKIASELEQSVKDIETYLELAFMDAEMGGTASVPFYSGTASLIGRMNEHFGWDMDRTLETPYRVIYQLLRYIAHGNGVGLKNERSMRISNDFFYGPNGLNAQPPEKQKEWLAQFYEDGR